MIEAKQTEEWCVVNYDNEAYPGVMDAEGHIVKVKCMHRNEVSLAKSPGGHLLVSWWADTLPNTRTAGSEQALCTDWSVCLEVCGTATLELSHISAERERLFGVWSLCNMPFFPTIFHLKTLFLLFYSRMFDFHCAEWCTKFNAGRPHLFNW